MKLFMLVVLAFAVGFSVCWVWREDQSYTRAVRPTPRNDCFDWAQPISIYPQQFEGKLIKLIPIKVRSDNVDKNFKHFEDGEEVYVIRIGDPNTNGIMIVAAVEE